MAYAIHTNTIDRCCGFRSFLGWFLVISVRLVYGPGVIFRSVDVFHAPLSV